MDTATEIVDATVRVGMAAFLIILLVGGSKKWWVFGHVFEAMREERDEWRRQANELLTIAIKNAIEDDAQQTKGRR